MRIVFCILAKVEQKSAACTTPVEKPLTPPPDNRLTWSLPPHPPAGGLATRHHVPHDSPSRVLRQYRRPAGLTSKPHHAHSCFELLTWIVSPATGLDLQPQTRRSGEMRCSLSSIIPHQAAYMHRKQHYAQSYELPIILRPVKKAHNAN